MYVRVGGGERNIAVSNAGIKMTLSYFPKSSLPSVNNDDPLEFYHICHFCHAIL